MKRITINPITRLEGHGKIEIFLDDNGNVENAYLQIPELRGFEKFCEGKHVEEMPRLTAKICGVCPEAHHLAAAKAADAVYKAAIPPAAKKLRELFYCAHILHSHIAHFYALSAPDFVVGSDAPAAQRNILGLVAKMGAAAVKEVVKHRALAQEIQGIIGGRATYPVCALPGGCSKALTAEERKEIEEKAKSLLEFAKYSFKVFETYVLKAKHSEEFFRSEDIYHLKTCYMGLVDAKGKVNFYDGVVRVVDADGGENAKFKPAEYLDHVAERVEPWSYMKFPYLKKIGWKGFAEGADSGIVRVGPLARLNASCGMATPLAQQEYENLFEAFDQKPVHHTMAFHWARLIEMLYAAERLLELARDKEITSAEVRVVPTEKPSEGVGIVEAPRGTLIHHYKTNTEGVVTSVNLIVATTFNNPAMNMSIAKAAKHFIKKGKVTDAVLNMVEMAFRAYDPCMSCATHALPGRMPLIVSIRDRRGELLETLRRDER